MWVFRVLTRLLWRDETRCFAFISSSIILECPFLLIHITIYSLLLALHGTCKMLFWTNYALLIQTADSYDTEYKGIESYIHEQTWNNCILLSATLFYILFIPINEESLLEFQFSLFLLYASSCSFKLYIPLSQIKFQLWLSDRTFSPIRF